MAVSFAYFGWRAGSLVPPFPSVPALDLRSIETAREKLSMEDQQGKNTG